MEDNKERRSTLHPLDRKIVLPLLRLLRDPSESVRIAALRSVLVLLPIFPELRLEIEDYVSTQEALAVITASGPGLDGDTKHGTVVPVNSETVNPFLTPEELRQRFLEAIDFNDRFYPALNLASLGEPEYLKKVFRELEQGSLNLSIVRYVREQYRFRHFPPTVAKQFELIAADNTRRGDVRQIAFILSQRSKVEVPDFPSQKIDDSPKCADLQQYAAALANSYLHLLSEEFVVPTGDNAEALSYLDQKRATALVTALFLRLLEEALDQDQGYMAGNGVVCLVASLGPAFVPDIPALFEVYLRMHELVLPARTEWYRTKDDYLIFFSTNYLAVSWQLAWTLSRAGIRQVLADLAPSLLAADVNKRLAAAQLIEDVIRYVPIVYPPQFGGGSGPPGVDISESILDKIKALETVNFTTYYPRTCVLERKYGFVVYAHLPELRNDVNLDAQKFSAELGDSIPTQRRSRSNVKLERDTLITVVPECREVEFDPPELTKRWDGSWTRFLFDFKLDQELVSEVLLVRISIQVAGIEIACISNCAIEVIESQQCDADDNPLAHAKLGSQTSYLYQRIFVSYSRQDREITERYKLAQIALGNEAFIDVDDLRAGENWKAGLARAIDVVDVFQLFWSENSANSEYCRYEWNYALEFRCPDSKCEGFIRPVYWEKPMPDPPPELSHVNFKYVPFDGNAKLNKNRVEGELPGRGREG